MDSQVEAAKLVVEFAKTNDKMKVKGGVVDGGFITADRVVALSKVPSRDELIAKMMGSDQLAGHGPRRASPTVSPPR